MKKLVAAIIALVAACAMCAFIAGCSSGDYETELRDMREVTWEDTILTINLGVNKTTGCEWSVDIGDDSVIGYGITRVFHLSDEDNVAAGYSEITFEGKGAGSTTITFTTPKDWDGNEPGYTFRVFVLVNDDGTIANANGE